MPATPPTGTLASLCLPVHCEDDPGRPPVSVCVWVPDRIHPSDATKPFARGHPEATAAGDNSPYYTCLNEVGFDLISHILAEACPAGCEATGIVEPNWTVVQVPIDDERIDLVLRDPLNRRQVHVWRR